MNLYAQELIDHYKNSKNKRRLENAQIETEEFNPSCGDKVKFYAYVSDNKFKEITFEGFGCVISQATASILSDYFLNKPISDVLGCSPDKVMELIHLNLGLTRLKCATLPLEALQKGVGAFLKGTLQNAK